MPLQDSSKRASAEELLARAAAAVDGHPGINALTKRAATHTLSGDHRQHRAGSGERFWQFREYETGDSPQSIDWRQSAKRERLYVRQQEWQTPQRSLFRVDDNPGMAFTSHPGNIPAKGDFAGIVALGLGMLLTRNGEHVGTLLPGVTAGHSTGTLHQLADHLTTQVPGSDRDSLITELMSHKLPRHATPVILSDCLQAPDILGGQLDTLAERTGPGLLVQVLDPAELALPYRGRIIFEGLAGDTTIPVPEAGDIADAYRQRIDAHCSAIAGHVQSRGWLYCQLSTDTEPSQALSTLWEALHDRQEASG
jgi:uncharacterized protein (DUF58 family)